MVKPIRLTAAGAVVCAATIARPSPCSDLADGAAPLYVAFNMSLATLHTQSSGQSPARARRPEPTHSHAHSPATRAQRVGDPI
jgi:hypothetical protein